MGEHRVVWLGGGAAAGKTTICSRFSVEYGCQVYDCDANINKRLALAEPGTAAYVFREILGSETAGRDFFERSASEIANAYVSWAAETFGSVERDVNLASKDSPVVVDGAFELLPRLLDGKVDRRDAVFLFSTTGFQEKIWRERNWYLHYTQKTADPAAAAERWILANVKLTAILKEECSRFGFRSIVTGGELPVDVAYHQVVQAFGLLDG